MSGDQSSRGAQASDQQQNRASVDHKKAGRRIVALAIAFFVVCVAAVGVVFFMMRSDQQRKTENLKGATASVPILPPRPWIAVYREWLEPAATVKADGNNFASIAFSSDGKRVVTSSRERHVAVWAVADGASLGAFEGHTDRVAGAAFGPGDAWLISGGDRTVRVWDLASQKQSRALPVEGSQVSRIELGPGAKRVVAATLSGHVSILEVDSGRVVCAFDHAPAGRGRLFAAAFDPTGRRVATAGEDRAVRLWRASDCGADRSIEAHSGPINQLAFSPDGETIASASDDHSARLWNANTGALASSFDDARDEVWNLAFSPDGELLAVGGKDPMIRVYDAKTGKPIRAFRHDAQATLGVAFSPDGSGLASAHPHRIKIWHSVRLRPKLGVPRLGVAPPRPSTAEPRDAEHAAYAEAMATLDDWSGRSTSLDRAEKSLRKLIEDSPRFALGYVAMARLESQRGMRKFHDYDPQRMKAAHAYVDRAIEIDPKSFEAHLRRARLFLLVGDSKSAHAPLDQAAKLRPDALDVDEVAGGLAIEERRLDDAERRLRRVVENSPDAHQSERVYAELEWLYKLRGEYDGADEVLRTLVEVRPKSVWSKGNYAGFLALRGDFDRAIEMANAAIAQMDYGLVHTALADAHFGKGVVALWDHDDAAAAESEFRLGLEADPKHSMTHYGLGAIMRRDAIQRRDVAALEAARKEFESAVALDAKNWAARRALEQHRLCVEALKNELPFAPASASASASASQ